ncbi:MAG: hypothetical protein IKT83_02975 [Bacteroidaceae bacterium]|nr:hypothetical protein [Bacteroidaceae bacterium]MBR5776587.1 hypothetical protein [Bacteroidaceae bacterium]
MKLDKVGRGEWDALEIGAIGIFTLPNKRAREVARVSKSQVEDLSEPQKKFERVSWDELREKYGDQYEMVVPDESLTLAFRRVK